MVFPCNSAWNWRRTSSLAASSLATPAGPTHYDKASLAIGIARPAAGPGPSRIASNSASLSSAADFSQMSQHRPGALRIIISCITSQALNRSVQGVVFSAKHSRMIRKFYLFAQIARRFLTC